MTLEGIDTYHSNPPLTTQACAGKAFWIGKVTGGDTHAFKDPAFAANLAVARKHVPVVGGYCFGAGDVDGGTQADYFLARLHELGVDPGGLLLALDVERNRKGGITITGEQADQFIARMHARGYQIGLYQSDLGWVDRGQDWRWIPRYPGPPVHPCEIHQYAGVKGFGDLDRTELTVEGLRKLTGSGLTAKGGEEDMTKQEVEEIVATLLGVQVSGIRARFQELVGLDDAIDGRPADFRKPSEHDYEAWKRGYDAGRKLVTR
jgi:Glycosyl hydrolases family 25